MELKDLSLDEVVEQLTKLKSMHEKADFWKLRIVLSGRSSASPTTRPERRRRTCSRSPRTSAR